MNRYKKGPSVNGINEKYVHWSWNSIDEVKTRKHCNREIMT